MERWREEEIGRSRRGTPIRAFLPARTETLLVAGVHGEEPETVWLARRLLERVAGDEATMAIVACANPDGTADSIRQNAAGVDLNRNFPAATWQGDPTFTYPPGIDPELRHAPHRTNRSSPGAHPGSEPEAQALMALVERLRPPLVIDVHAPLELILARGAEAVAAALGRSADLPVQDELDGPCPGAFDDWLGDRGIPALVYEVEPAGLPALCARHLPGLEAVLRGTI
jgi:protein MpaA